MRAETVSRLQRSKASRFGRMRERRGSPLANSWRYPMKRQFRFRVSLVAVAILYALVSSLPAARGQETYTPTPENLKARAWFQDAKFGLFIHWGVYSVLGDGEWIMETRPINRTDYARLPGFFNPTKFDPAAWVALAKAAGMKYITITSKHHDGFAMFNSKLTDWNVVARTPYGKSHGAAGFGKLGCLFELHGRAVA